MMGFQTGSSGRLPVSPPQDTLCIVTISRGEALSMSLFDRLKRMFDQNPVQKPDPVVAPMPAPSDVASPVPAVPPLANDRRNKDRVNARNGTRVLVIDDSATIVTVLCRMLKQNGYEALEAFDAEQGIAMARSENPDIIFLDIVLPGMNGFAALRMLRRDPITKTVPIIMMSGNEQATEAFYVQRIGADDFMKKPFSRPEVFARIERLLDIEMIPRRPAAVAAAVAGDAEKDAAKPH